MKHLLRALIVTAICLAGLASAKGASISGKVTCKRPSASCDSVVYAERIPAPAVLPAPGRPVVLDQVNLMFVPHILPVLVGTTVVFPNHDEVPHNVYSASPAKIFNIGIYPKGASRRITFDRPGEIALLCNIHPQMSAYILVLEQPYFTVSAKDGAFTLKGLPPGKYKVTAWHPHFKPASRTMRVKDNDKPVVNFDFRDDQ